MHNAWGYTKGGYSCSDLHKDHFYMVLCDGVSDLYLCYINDQVMNKLPFKLG